MLKFLLFWCVLLVGSFSQPVDEFSKLTDIEEDLKTDENSASHLMGIIPSGYVPMISSSINTVLDKINQDNKYLKTFKTHYEKGDCAKGSIFNIYNDDMRNAAIALFKLLDSLNEEYYDILSEWCDRFINDQMVDYAQILVNLYGKNKKDKINPPFITNPNYFFNSETIYRIMKLKLSKNIIDANNEISIVKDVIYVNSNYSNWNMEFNQCDKLNYFREDIGLNSYYYGLHLLHPFWMSNFEMDRINFHHADYYYYAHQQLFARYLLEKENDEISMNKNGNCDKTYNPYLVYNNGLQFPIRPVNKGKWNDEHAYLTTIDIAIKECISRGLIFMDNGQTINMTEENHTNLLSKLIRANLDSVKSAKIIRNLYGIGENAPISYTPSILHHPETSLRDPLYWQLIENILDYFTEYKTSLEPTNLSSYESNEYKIEHADLMNMTTYFSDYAIKLDRDIENNVKNFYYKTAVKQRRLNHEPLQFNFSVVSKTRKDVSVSLFLGPNCEHTDCWDSFNKFFQLDDFKYILKEGNNEIIWSSEKSEKYSKDFENIKEQEESEYSIFKFPERLIVPRGSNDGINVTLFIIITDDYSNLNNILNLNYQTDLSDKIQKFSNDKPLGFPFNKRAIGFSSEAPNYKFYDLKIFHKISPSKLFGVPNDLF